MKIIKASNNTKFNENRQNQYQNINMKNETKSKFMGK